MIADSKPAMGERKKLGGSSMRQWRARTKNPPKFFVASFY
jgi:hypothetical protein